MSTAMKTIFISLLLAKPYICSLHVNFNAHLSPIINPITPPLYNYCQLPSDPNIMAIRERAGWATEDLKCQPGNWCPYACKPGMYSPQWDPSVKCEDPNHCGSTHGGLFCNANAELVIPFPNRPLCEKGLDNVELKNEAGKSVSVCQTVYPGSEIMLISTVLNTGDDQVQLTTLPKSFWMGAGAHFYANSLGSTSEECRWGDKTQPLGNWSPYIIGSSQGYQDGIYIRVSMNPNFHISFGGRKPDYKIRIECSKGECNNTPCIVKGNTHHEECVVAVKANSRAKIVFFN